MAEAPPLATVLLNSPITVATTECRHRSLTITDVVVGIPTFAKHSGSQVIVTGASPLFRKKMAAVPSLSGRPIEVVVELSMGGDSAAVRQSGVAPTLLISPSVNSNRWDTLVASQGATDSELSGASVRQGPPCTVQPGGQTFQELGFTYVNMDS